MLRIPRIQLSYRSPTFVFLIINSLLIAAFYPGVIGADALVQLQEARNHQYSNWHPPIMAWLWSVLMGLTGAVPALWLLYQLLFVGGVALFIDGCRRTNRTSVAWAIGAAGCWPLFVFYNRLVIKDVGMVAALLAGLGLLFWFRAQERKMPLWATIAAAGCVGYGILVRINAVFALGPLVLIFFPRLRRNGAVSTTAIFLTVSLAAIGASKLINERMIGATRLDVIQQLQIFDLMGIEARSGDVTVWSPHAAPLEEVRSCYSAFWWDNFASWGDCAEIREKVGQAGNTNSAEIIEERAKLWRQAIFDHPGDYIIHRLAHFNSSIFFLVPAYHLRFKHRVDSSAAASIDPDLQRKIHLDYLKINFLAWPVTWLTIGLIALVAIPRFDLNAGIAGFSRLLILSGLLYSGAYLFIGIATEIRYHYWSIFSILIGCLLSYQHVAAGFKGRQGMIARWALGWVVLAGYAARLADIPLF
jgi:hypothetical protein